MDKNISVTIIEDDFLTGINLKQLVEKEGFSVDKLYASGEEYLSEIHQSSSEIVFIDVELNGKTTGIDIGKKLIEDHPEKYLIYVTGKYDKETISDILSLNPACYIKKPYDESTLMVNLNLVVSKINSLPRSEQSKITVHDGIKSYSLFPNDILYLKSDGNYVEFHLANNEVFLVRKKLNDINTSEDFNQFIRTHNRYLINPTHVFHYSYRNMIIGKTEIPISEKYRPLLRKIFS